MTMHYECEREKKSRSAMDIVFIVRLWTKLLFECICIGQYGAVYE